MLDQPLRVRPGRRLPSPEHPRSHHSEIAYRRSKTVTAGAREGMAREIDAAGKEHRHHACEDMSRADPTVTQHLPHTFSAGLTIGGPCALAAASSSAIQ